MSVHTRKLPGDGNVRPGTVFYPEAKTVLPSSPETQPEKRHPEAPVAPHDAPQAHDSVVPTPAADGAAALPWYRKERWLVVQLAALIPILGAMLAPEAYRVLLCIVGGVLVAIGTVMMLRHDPAGARPSQRAGAGSS
jgi:hypothetical protein